MPLPDFDHDFFGQQSAQTLAALGATEPRASRELFAEIVARFDGEVAAVHDEASWKLFRDAWLGRKSGVLTLVTDNWLKPATPELKRVVGAELNKLRGHVESQIESKRVAIEAGADEAALARERVDLSLPGVTRPVGSHHLIRQVFQQIEDIFVSIGFSVVEGPEIETPYYNFEALNIPEFHPVRDDMDTFYIDAAEGRAVAAAAAHAHVADADSHDGKTPAAGARDRSRQGLSPRQSRRDAFFRVSSGRRAGGRYRHHVLRFHRHDRIFREAIFRARRENALSAELFPVHRAFGGVRRDVRVLRRQRRFGRRRNVLEMQRRGLDRTFRRGHGRSGGLRIRRTTIAKKVSGFAFGIGIDRLAMLKYGIDDIQVFFQSDVRFLRQFP